MSSTALRAVLRIGVFVELASEAGFETGNNPLAER